jgi:hypothetical protein
LETSNHVRMLTHTKPKQALALALALALDKILFGV